MFGRLKLILYFALRFKNEYSMSRVCQITGKKAQVGNSVSHANNKTKRRFNVNLMKKCFYVPSEDKWVQLRVSANGLKTINKIGIEAALERARKEGLIK